MSIAADFRLFPAKNIPKIAYFWRVLIRHSVFFSEIYTKKKKKKKKKKTAI